MRAAVRVADRMAVAVTLTARGEGIARRLGLRTEPFAALEDLFLAGEDIVAVMACGIVIRRLAPHLNDKRREPAVVAVAEDGRVVVPLLGGHRGANRLARRVARALGVTPAITTASDSLFGVALDDPPEGWTVANPEAAKRLMAALIAGEAVRLEGRAPWLAALPFADKAPLTVRVTDRAGPGDNETLILHPPTLVLGVGLERGVPADVLADHVDRVLGEAGLARASVFAVGTLDLKTDEPAVEALGPPVHGFDARTLAAISVPTPSPVVEAAVGTPSVAEAAAVAAAGPGSELVVPKRIGSRVTAAVARIAPPRGKLLVVGIGPGGSAMRTAEAVAAVGAASDIVGYGPYLDLASDLIGGKRRHALPIGAETERVDLALGLAAEGRDVVLLASGDPGIFALAGRVLERAAADLEVRVVPGVSAMQAAAARAGAPLGHDFAAISLSDLLTPPELIDRRVRAAVEGDYVIALYNPASRTRRHPFERSMATIRKGRTPDTPVVRARSVGRDDEFVAIETLDSLDEAAVDMMTVLIVGNSRTRIRNGRVVTPRGYPE